MRLSSHGGVGVIGGGASRRRVLLASLAVSLLVSLLVVAPQPPEASAQTTPTANADGTYTVPRDWPLIPSGIGPGQRFRLLFLTTRWDDATSTDIATYDTIVQGEIGKTSGNPNQIGHPAIRPYASLFKVVGSTATVDAINHTGMTGDGYPIYWLNGPRVAMNYKRFWQTWENWAEADRRDQAGTQSPNDWPWTGTQNTGFRSPNPLGHSSVVIQGRFKVNNGDTGQLNHITSPRTQMHSFYGISPVFVVEELDTLTLKFDHANPSKTTVDVLNSSVEGVVRYSYDGVDPYDRSNVYEDDRPGASFMVEEPSSCVAGAGVDTSVWHPDKSTYGAYQKLTYTVALEGPPPTRLDAVVAIYGPEDKHPRDRRGFKEQYEPIFKKQLAIAGRTSPMRGMGNQLPLGRVSVPTSRLSFSAADWMIPQEVEVWVRCANSHNAWEDIHIFHGVYPAGTTGGLGRSQSAEWFEVTVTVIDQDNTKPTTDGNSEDAYPGRVHVHLDGARGKSGGGFVSAGESWLVPVQLHWRTPRIDAFQAGDIGDQQKVNDPAAAMKNFRKFNIKVEGMAKGMSNPRSDGEPTYADGDRLPNPLTWDVSPERLVSGKGDPFENYYPAYFRTPNLTMDSVVYSPGSPIYRVTVTPYSIRGNPVPGEKVQQCIHVRSSDEDPVTGVGATEFKQFYNVACPSNFPEAPASQLEAEPPMLTLSTAAQWVDEGADATFTITADRTPLLDTTVNVYLSQEMGEGLDYVGAEEAAQVTLPAGQRSVDWTVTSYSDDQERADGTIEARINPGDAYGVTNPLGVSLPFIDDDGAGPALDPQLEADVRSYAAETQHGVLHVNRWKRVLEAFGLEDYAGLEPTTLDEARVHVDIGRPRWIPVLAHMVAMDAADPQPPAPTSVNVQVDAQVLATARSKAAQTHGGAKHVNRWKRVLEAFGDADYPGIEPLTAAGAQVYANVWSGWDQVAAQLRLIEAAATTDPPPVVVAPVVVAPTPVVGITSSAGGTEGDTVSFTLTAVPAPAADLDVDVSVVTSGDFGYGPIPSSVTIPTGGAATVTVTTVDDSVDELDGSVTLTIDAGSGYTVSATQGTAAVDVVDDDVAPLPSSAQNGPALDAQLEADVRSYAAETQHGVLHVNRWKRVLEAFGLEDYAGLEPTTLDEARVHVDIGRPRWIPVLAHMVAMDAVNPQPPPARGSVQVDAQVLATARSKAAQTHGGVKHMNRWKRVLEAFGDGDYPGVEPLTAAGAQVYANVWSGWDQVAAQLRLIEAAATTDPTPVVVPPVVVAPTPEVSITSSAGGTEGATVSFTLTASPVPAADLDVDVSVVTSGDFGYGPTPTSVTIPTGGTATVTVTTSDDSADEPDGSVTLTINAGSGYTVGAYGSDSVDVTDDDDPVAPVVVVPDPVVSITAGQGVTEGAGATFTVTAVPAPASDLPVTVTVSQNGAFGANTGSRTVTVPTGGSVSFTVATTDDSVDESDGSVTATVNAGSGYTVSTTHGAGTVNVSDNDVPQISITEGQGVSEGGDATFTLTAVPAPATALDVAVTITQDGDYGAVTGSRTVTVPTSGSVSFTVATTDDATDEPDGSVTVTVDAGSGYTVSTSQGADTVSVADNDVPPPASSVTVSVGDATGSEAGGVVEFTVSLSEASSEQVRVWFSTSNWRGLTGRAHMWLDYWTAQQTVVFAPGQTKRTVSVWLVDDSRSEPDEYFTVTLTNPRGATIEDGAATGTITDDD